MRSKAWLAARQSFFRMMRSQQHNIFSMGPKLRYTHGTCMYFDCLCCEQLWNADPGALHHVLRAMLQRSFACRLTPWVQQSLRAPWTTQRSCGMSRLAPRNILCWCVLCPPLVLVCGRGWDLVCFAAVTTACVNMTSAAVCVRHSGEIALAGLRRLRSTLAAAPVLFAHARMLVFVAQLRLDYCACL
jgi:hypothetical protein